MLLQRVWGVRRLKNVRRLGMLGGTLASCALALATVVPSAYALACGNQTNHKTTHTSTSHIHKTSSIRYVYVYECSCEKAHHPLASSPSNHKSDGDHGSSSHSSSDHGSSSHSSSDHGSSSHSSNGSSSNGSSSNGSSSSGNGSGTPRLPFTGNGPL